MNIDNTQEQRLKNQGLLRLLACATASITTLSASSLVGFHPAIIITVCLLFVYLSVSYYLLDKGSLTHQGRRILIAADTMILSGTITLMGFEPLPSSLICLAYGVALLGYTPYQRYGYLSIFLATCGLCYLCLPVTIILSEVSILAISLMGGLYVLVSSGLIYKQNTQLSQQLDTANHDKMTLEHRSLHLAKYLSPTIRRAIGNGRYTSEESKEKNITIFFSDLSGFTELAEQLETEDLALFLQVYLTEMTEIALRFGGTLDKIVGDSIMVFFGDPESRGIENDALSCVSMALTMRAAMAKLKKRWQAAGIENPPSLRMGINSGLCKVGHFGAEHLLTYTLLGRSVNLASRLESAAENEEILISLSTYGLVKDSVSCLPKGQLTIKGFNQPVIAYSVIGLSTNPNREPPAN